MILSCGQVKCVFGLGTPFWIGIVLRVLMIDGRYYGLCVYSNTKLLVLLVVVVVAVVVLVLLTAIELSLGGSSPYTSTEKTNKNKCT